MFAWLMAWLIGVEQFIKYCASKIGKRRQSDCSTMLVLIFKRNKRTRGNITLSDVTFQFFRCWISSLVFKQSLILFSTLPAQPHYYVRCLFVVNRACVYMCIVCLHVFACACVWCGVVCVQSRRWNPERWIALKRTMTSLFQILHYLWTCAKYKIHSPNPSTRAWYGKKCFCCCSDFHMPSLIQELQRRAVFWNINSFRANKDFCNHVIVQKLEMMDLET